MGIDTVKTGKLLYHLTDIHNLDSIFENGLLPRKYVLNKGIGFIDIADHNIIDKRTRLGLDKYTPFHFHPYSAFDVAVKSNGNAQHMVYLCIDRLTAKENAFLILPRHPLSGNEYKLYNYEEGFNKIDWNVMMELGREDSYAKEVKMAECLTDKKIPINCFACLYVASEDVKKEVEKMLRSHKISNPPYVNVQSVWFDNYS